MKTKLIILISLVAITSKAQVSIGKTPAASNSSISLDFYDNADNAKAMILPWVTESANVAGSVDGTLIFDTKDKIVKVKRAGTWFNLSSDTTGQVVTTLQDTKTENASAKVQIGGSSTDTTPGILVLADTNKAMVLPKVASPHLKIVKPEPGTIVYDTVAKQLAIFNGTEWSFWKP